MGFTDMENRNSEPFYITGGTLPVDATSYVERRADLDLTDSLRTREYCYVLNSRQMGKSSLCVRAIQRLREEGVRTAFVDLTRIGAQNVKPDQWYAGLLAETGRALNLRNEFLRHWKERQELSPVQRYFGAIREVALTASEAPLVVFVDEIDAVRSLGFSADEFFAAVRACHNARTEDPLYKNLTFCLVGSATPADLITDTRMSPFNVGRRIELRDFTPEEAAPLAEGLIPQPYGPNGMAQPDRPYGSALDPSGRSADRNTDSRGAAESAEEGRDSNPNSKIQNRKLLDRVLYWTGGHPYLTQRLCRAVAEIENRKSPIENASVDRLCSELFLTHTAVETDDNLSFVRSHLLRSDVDLASLLDLYTRMRSASSVPDDETNALTSVLKLSGIARVERGQLKIRNRIYNHVFDSAWIVAHMPDAELRRQRTAYRRGMVRAIAVASIIVAMMGGLAAYALGKAREASKARDEARTNLTSANREKETVRSLADSLRVINGRLTSSLNETRNALALAEKRRVEAGKSQATAVKSAGIAESEKLRANGEASRATEAAVTARLAAAAAKTARDSAVREAESNRLTTYTAQVAQAQTYADAGVSWRARDLLLAHNPKPGQKDLRGFEWRYLWKTSGDGSTATFSEFDGLVSGVAVSPNSKLLAYGARRTVILRDIERREIVGRVEGLPDEVSALEFSPGGRLLAIGHGSSLSVRDLKTGRTLVKADGFQGHVWSIKFSPNGALLLVKTPAYEARLIDMVSGHTIQNFTGVSGVSCSFAPDGKRLYLSTTSRISVWNIGTQKFEEYYKLTRDADTFALSPDGRWLATGDNSGKVQLFETNDSGRQDSRTPAGTIDAHSGMVLSLAFTPDSKTLISAGFDSSIRLWNVSARTLNAILPGHPASVEAVAVTRDGRWLLSGGRQGAVKLWALDRKPSDTVLELPDYSRNFKSKISPDNRRLITAANGTSFDVVDLATGSARSLSYPDGAVMPLTGAPTTQDGRAVFGYTYGNTLVRQNSDRTAVSSYELAKAGRRFWVSRDGTSVAESTSTGAMIVHDIATGRELGKFPYSANDGVFPSLDGRAIVTQNSTEENGRTFFSWRAGPDGLRTLLQTRDDTSCLNIASGNSSVALFNQTAHTITVYRLSDGKPLHILNLSSQSSYAAGAKSMSADLRRAACDNDEDSATFYDVEGDKAIATVKEGGAISSIHALPDGSGMVWLIHDADKWRIVRWRVGEQGGRIVASGLGKATIYRLLPDGRVYCSVRAAPQSELTLHLLNLDSGQDVTVAHGVDAEEAGGLSNSGSLLTVRRRHMQALRWELASGNAETLRIPTEENVMARSVSRNGKSLLAWGGSDVRVYDIGSGETLCSFKMNEPIETASLTADDRAVLVREANSRRTILRDIRSGKDTPLPNGFEVRGFSSDGRLFVSFDRNEVTVRNSPSGAPRYILHGHTDIVRAAAFSNDSMLLATGGDDRTIRIWNAVNGAEVMKLEGHTGAVLSLAFSPDGRTFASLGGDKLVRVWNLATRQEMLRLPDPTSTVLPGFSDDGRVLVASDGGRIRLWRAPEADGNVPELPLKMFRTGSSQPATVPEKVSHIAHGRGKVTAAQSHESMGQAGWKWLRSDDKDLLREISEFRVDGLKGSQRAANVVPYNGLTPRWTQLYSKGTAFLTANQNGASVVEVKEIGQAFLNMYGLNLRPGKPYIIQFRARSDTPRTTPIWLEEDHQPFRRMGLDVSILIDSNWTAFRIPVMVSGEVEPGRAGFTFYLGTAVGRTWIADLAIIPMKAGSTAPITASEAQMRQVTDHRLSDGGESKDSANLLRQGISSSGWNLYQNADTGSKGSLDMLKDGSMRVQSHIPTKGVSDVEIRSANVTIVPGRNYVGQLRVRADRPMSARLSIVDPNARNRIATMNADIGLSNAWQSYRVRFAAGSIAADAPTAVAISLGGQVGTAWFSDILLVEDDSGQVADSYIGGSGQADTFPEVARLEPDGEVVRNEPGFREFRVQGLNLQESAPARARFQTEGGVIRIDVTAPADDYKVQVQHVPPNIVEGETYLVRFRAKADHGTNVLAFSQVLGGDYHGTGLSERIALNKEWKSFEYRVTVRDLQKFPTSLPNINLGAEIGTYWMSDVSVTTAAPLTADLWLQAEALARAGKWKECVQRMEEAFKRNPSPPGAWWQPLAVAYLKVGDTAGYRRICGQMIATGNDRPIYHATHIGPGGLADYRPLIESLGKTVSRPDASRADRCSLGALLYRAGQYERAATVLTAIVADPENPHTDACFYLAMALHRLNRRTEAQQAMEAAHRLMAKPIFTDFWIGEQFKLQQHEAESLLAGRFR